MKKRVLVTGGAGFIGSNFCNLNQAEYEIIVLDNLFLGDPSNLTKGTKFIKGDACNTSDLEKCGDQFDVVIHLAGTSSAPMFMEDGMADGYINSIASFVRTIEFARKTGVKKFIYASTSSLYGNNPLPLLETQTVEPLNHYAATKFCYEHCAKCFHKVYPEMDIFGFRFMSVYGPHEEAKGQFANMISQFLWDIARDLPPVIYGDGEQFRDFTNVADIVQAMNLAINTPEGFGNKVYNIGRGESTSFNEIFTALNQALHKNIEPIYIPNPVKEGYVKGQHADIGLIQTELGFNPKITLEEGIKPLVANLDKSKIKETSSDLIRSQYV